MKKALFLLLAWMAAAVPAPAMALFDNPRNPCKYVNQCTSDECACRRRYCLFDVEGSFDIGAGYRDDCFKWNTVSPNPHSEKPRRLQESWNNIGMGILELNTEVLAYEHWLFKGDFDYGWFEQIKQQKVTGFNFSQWRFINATSKVKGVVYDISAGFGYQLNWDCPWASIAPLAGWSYEYQYFKNNHYFNHISHSEFKENNHYKFSWNGPWIGFAAVYFVCSEWQFYLDYAFHWAQFRAKFHDSFLTHREQLIHSRSNQAYGNEVTVGTSYQFCVDWFLGFKFNYKEFWADKATTSLKRRTEGPHDHQKNIRWETYYLTAEVGYLF